MSWLINYECPTGARLMTAPRIPRFAQGIRSGQSPDQAKTPFRGEPPLF